MVDAARLSPLSSRVLRASSIAGMYALVFGVAFYALLLVSLLGLLPLAGWIAAITVGSLAILAFCASVVYLAVERRLETRAQDTRSRVMRFVQENEIVVREVGANAGVSVVATRGGRDGLEYEVSASGTRRLYVIVNASTTAPTARLTLVCTTSVPLGQRDAFKHACSQ